MIQKAWEIRYSEKYQISFFYKNGEKNGKKLTKKDTKK